MNLKTRFTFLLLLAATLAILGTVSVFAQPREELVSPALMILAEQSGMAKASNEMEIVFSADDFEKALNVSSISYVTVEVLPERADGILYLGESEVQEGQLISRANIPHLKFVFMNKDIKESAFCFTTNHGMWDIKCSLFTLEYHNECPTVSSVSDLALTVGTYSDVAVYGQLDAYDPDGDAMVYEIVEYPSDGLLIVSDKTTGSYKYIPQSNATGADVFRYVAVDRYGNYSKSARVTIEVAKRGSAPVYHDLEDRASHVAAITLTEQGIMSSTELDGRYYFYPEQQVTRAEFLTMAMKTLGVQAADDTATTVFSDDADISSQYRGYINTAQKLGYVCGRINEAGDLLFAPNDGITRAEAAKMIQNMISLEIPVIKPMFVDSGTVPAWAKDAVFAMTSAGIMTYSGGYVSADSVITREECAQMLYMLGKIS